MDYQLELKQIVDFPRCRIYREFIQTLIKDRNIRTNGSSCLFYFLILCSYANYSSSYRNIEHLTYTVAPGEWICTLKELQHQFRFRFQIQGRRLAQRQYSAFLQFSLQKRHWIFLLSNHKCS